MSENAHFYNLSPSSQIQKNKFQVKFIEVKVNENDKVSKKEADEKDWWDFNSFTLKQRSTTEYLIGLIDNLFNYLFHKIKQDHIQNFEEILLIGVKPNYEEFATVLKKFKLKNKNILPPSTIHVVNPNPYDLLDFKGSFFEKTNKELLLLLHAYNIKEVKYYPIRAEKFHKYYHPKKNGKGISLAFGGMVIGEDIMSDKEQKRTANSVWSTLLPKGIFMFLSAGEYNKDIASDFEHEIEFEGKANAHTPIFIKSDRIKSEFVKNITTRNDILIAS